MVSKYEYLILPGAFPHKVTPYIDFTDESVVQSGNTCKVPVVEILYIDVNIYKFMREGKGRGLMYILFLDPGAGLCTKTILSLVLH